MDSAVAAGEQVGLRLRVYGEKGHIAWEQSDPDKLTFALQSEAARTLVRGRSGLSPAAKRATRIVAGLPEGYFEAFATLYRDYADILVARQAGAAPVPLALWVPMAEDGVRGMAFVEAALALKRRRRPLAQFPAGDLRRWRQRDRSDLARPRFDKILFGGHICLCGGLC